MNQEELRKKLQKIVESIETIEPVADFDSDQWKKGNASLKLIGKSISSLNVNIKKNEYGVGIDGNNKGDILDFLKSNFKFNNENDQNERYKVKPEKIEEVVRYYAGVKQENMEKVLFCRITSMEYYQDIDGDTQEGGGSYTKDNLAHERFNFKIRDGIFKGFVQSSSKTGGMNLKKIDPIVNEDADSVNGVLVIFVADNNIVGYYKDATVYGSIQNNDNYDQGRYDAYNIKTQSKAVLLSPDSRDYEIPRGSGAMGQANTFYLYDDNGNEKQGKWIQEAVNYVKINQLVKSYIPQIIDYLNNNPNQIDELTSDNFGTTSYPLIKTIKEIEENDKGVEDNKTLHYRYWTETYTINNKKHRFHSQWGGHKVWNGEESSISSDEKHRNSFIDYLKEQGIYSLTLTPNIWKMSHGSDTESFRNEWLHDNKISLHTNTKSKGKSEYTQADNFKNNVKIGDVVLLSHGSNIKRLVEVVSEILNPDDEWIYREYKIIKQLDGNDNKYNGEQKWWTPNHNSTFIKVNDYCYFENLILTPFFNKTLQDIGVDKICLKVKEKNMTNEELQKKIKLLKHKKQIILQGSPGTGKTREAKEIAEEMAPNNYKLIQFHPAYSYEDFVRGIVATTTDDGQVSYKVQNKVLAEMAENANKEYKLAKDEDRKPTNFVLIIDEINRANLSSVLGELIYALEYRGEAVESMYELDGSREIVLPGNLYIIGTMNTADRSVGHIDYAIRRRFAFVDVNTDESVIPKNAKSLFGEIKHLFNEYLSEEFELNDVMIGHSYFLADDLKQALKYEIKPILYEYLKDGVLTCEKDKINDLKTIQIKG